MRTGHAARRCARPSALRGAALAACALLVAGCGDPKAASERNIERAVRDALEHEPAVCIDVPLKALPGESTTRVLQRTQDQLQALVASGLLQAEPVGVATTTIFGNPRTTPGFRYRATAQGERFLQPAASGRPRLCAGHRVLNGQVIFTPPTSANVNATTEATFPYTTADLPEWTRRADMRTAYAPLRALAPAAQNGRMTVVLQEDGWHAGPRPQR